MGGAIHGKKEQMDYLNNRITMVLNVLDAIDPEEAGVDEIDRIIDMLDELEFKCKQFRNSWSEE
ncbi:SE1561 family protein [Bacillus alkalicellulosilyticus]|uniref:SE1561 family protein n=1 Tax=Alkalihalobacterium alkalicellulosilyticum TaxID=1912214 RepID=UPI000997D948|nr:SE1561 family protein [Bacillus alkalicellulosilyticus]